ncbi:biotin--[acetyl-CoA-carboxylase] ligase [Natronomonas sp. EA1]|uniref:biotin--[acetyl-CoA-carboxylase] ligase n=1 Tax=Natronomonas sp. EA1 TaxID=3421655 RepID=UPI003EBFB531
MQETRRRVLDALAEGPITGPELAERLDVSRAAVWKHVEALRDQGFSIVSEEAGYRLVESPEYGEAAIAHGLEAPFAVEYHDAVPSTNERARELAQAGADETLVVAATQTASRGRLDREWSSPAGGVYASLLCRPEIPAAQAPTYTLAAAVAVARAARERGVEAGIKWPNDVLLPDTDGEGAGKLCGILTEMEGEADRVSWLVVGIGVNVNTASEDLPDTATSIREHVGEVDRAAFVQDIVEAFEAIRDDPDAILDAWRELSITLGQRVRVETPTGELVGEAVDIAFPGTLVVETESGTERVAAGDCEHLRPVSK